MSYQRVELSEVPRLPHLNSSKRDYLNTSHPNALGTNI